MVSNVSTVINEVTDCHIHKLSIYYQTRQGMCVQRNIEARSFNQSCNGKAVSITYSVCVCVCVCSLSNQAFNAHAPYHLWPTPLYNIFPHYLINDTIFEKKKIY